MPTEFDVGDVIVQVSDEAAAARMAASRLALNLQSCFAYVVVRVVSHVELDAVVIGQLGDMRIATDLLRDRHFRGRRSLLGPHWYWERIEVDASDQPTIMTGRVFGPIPRERLEVDHAAVELRAAAQQEGQRQFDEAIQQAIDAIPAARHHSAATEELWSEAEDANRNRILQSIGVPAEFYNQSLGESNVGRITRAGLQAALTVMPSVPATLQHQTLDVRPIQSVEELRTAMALGYPIAVAPAMVTTATIPREAASTLWLPEGAAVGVNSDAQFAGEIWQPDAEIDTGLAAEIEAVIGAIDRPTPSRVEHATAGEVPSETGLGNMPRTRMNEWYNAFASNNAGYLYGRSREQLQSREAGTAQKPEPEELPRPVENGRRIRML